MLASSADILSGIFKSASRTRRAMLKASFSTSTFLSSCPCRSSRSSFSNAAFNFACHASASARVAFCKPADCMVWVFSPSGWSSLADFPCCPRFAARSLMTWSTLTTICLLPGFLYFHAALVILPPFICFLMTDWSTSSGMRQVRWSTTRDILHMIDDWILKQWQMLCNFLKIE